MTTPAGAALAALVSICVAPDVPPEASIRAVQSCNLALGDGRCQLDGSSAAHAEWRATVTADSLGGVHIEVRSDSSAAAETRDLSFSPEDAEKERWASVGVVVAALVVAGSREPTPPRPPSIILTSPPNARPSPPSPPRQRTRDLRIELRVFEARRTTEGSPEIGGEVGASVLPAGGPWFGGLSIAGTRRFDATVGASWFSLGLGGGAHFGRPSAVLAAEIRGAAVAEYWRFDASEPGRSEATGNVRFGGLAGIDGLWTLSSRWILSLGIDGLIVGPRLRVDVEGRTVETIPGFGGLAAAGLRFLP